MLYYKLFRRDSYKSKLIVYFKGANVKRLLYISNRLRKEEKNGAYLASKRNYELLLNLNLKIDKYITIKSKKRIHNMLQTFIKGRLEINQKEENIILEKIKILDYEYIFFDGSSFGYLSEKIKKINKNIKIITFCHDINYYLYSSLLEIHKKDLNLSIKNIYKYLRLKKMIINSEINERKIFENSDMIITFNKRDTKLLLEKYNKKAAKEIPMSFSKNKILNFTKEVPNFRRFKLLFVGVAYHSPNIEGIIYFIENIIPRINVELIILGKNMELYKEDFEKKNSKIKVIGTVEKLDEYYLEADAVISPIFSGGGMKIKTGEALSYGKTIFGTTEAFEGYEVDYSKVGGLCNTVEEFIEVINNYIEWWKNNDKPTFNKYSYQIFKEKYSYEASLKSFKEIFEELEEKR